MTSQRASVQRTAARKSVAKPGFISDTIAELKKAIWLSRQEVAYLTGLVLIVVIVVGALLGVVDFGFSKLVDVLFIGR